LEVGQVRANENTFEVDVDLPCRPQAQTPLDVQKMMARKTDGLRQVFLAKCLDDRAMLVDCADRLAGWFVY
jgi:hypothetical protein